MNENESDFFSVNNAISTEINNYKNNFQKAKVVKFLKTNSLSLSSSGVKECPQETELTRLRHLIDSLPVASIIQDNEFRIIYMNPMAEEAFGFSTEETLGKDSFSVINPEYLKDYFLELRQDLQKGNMAVDGRSEIIKRNGESIICDWNEVPLYNEEGDFKGIISMYQDVSERMQNQWILEGQKKILEMIASGVSLSEVLQSIIFLIEQMSPRVKGSILTLDPDEQTLHTGAAPHLPNEYNQLVDQLKVGEYNGSCGTAVFRKQIVIVSDISTDKTWEKYKEIARHFNLNACTSIPVYGSKHQILGTFAFYYQQKTLPSVLEFKLIDIFSALTGIAIEKKLIERELKDKEEQYRIITENMDDLIFICDSDGKIVFSSSSIKKVFGEQIKDTNILNLVYKEDISIVKDLLKVVNPGEEITKLFRTNNKDSQLRWIEGTSKIIDRRNEQFILLTGHDITQLKLSADALKNSEKQLQEAEKVANLGSYKWDLHTDNHFWSPQLYRIFGYRPFEIEPNYSWFLKRIYPDDAGWLKEALRKAVEENQKLDITLRIIRKDKTIVYLECKCEVIYSENGEAMHMIGTAQDITARRKTEEKLLLSEKKFRTAFEYANIGFCLMYADHTFFKTNKAGSNILGYTIEDFGKLNIDSILHPENFEEFRKMLRRMLDDKLNSWADEVRLRHKHGHYIWGYLSVSLLRDEYHKPLYFIIVFQDISDKKTAEANQIELTNNLIKQNEALEQFSYITSHNLRAPIVNILSLIEIFSMNPNAPDKEIIIENIKTASQSLDNVIKDLNHIISFKKGTEEIKQEIIFEDLIQMVIKSLETQLNKADAYIILNLSSAPSMKSILSYCLSILSNLIENAIKYRSPQRKLIIKISSSIVDKYVCLQVCDNGLGINLDLQKGKVFGMYKRFHLHIEGKGIGLHLVKTQMEAMGGKVGILSKPQVGTCFHLFFQR